MSCARTSFNDPSRHAVLTRARCDIAQLLSPLQRPLDSNKDGQLTLEEMQAFMQGTRRSAPQP
jgi:hypothetical protein